MARRADHTREELTEMIVLSAEKIISTKGLSGMTTRGIAKDIGYTPGTLYQCFKDINGIIMAVHARSLKGLVKEMVAPPPSDDPEKMLHHFADVYLDYIKAHPKAWDALFEFRLPDDYEIPQWYTNYVKQLVGIIANCFEQMARTQNSKRPDDVTTTQAAQMVWASVHAVCSLESSGKMGIIIEEDLKPVIHRLVDLHIKAYVL